MVVWFSLKDVTVKYGLKKSTQERAIAIHKTAIKDNTIAFIR
ncbi:MAG: hypothetical protein AAGE84_16510 [Cyanobacteria bacterium P01_G01_bin.39]